MSPRDEDCLSTVPYTGPAVYTKPTLRSGGSVAELDDELSAAYDSDEEVVGPAEEAFGDAKVGGWNIVVLDLLFDLLLQEAASSYLGLATDYLASFKVAQLGLKAAYGVLDTLDRATRCEGDCKESLPEQMFNM